MSDRHEAVRRLCTEEDALAEVAARGLEQEGDSVLGLGILRRIFFPGLSVEVLELFDAPDDRVAARIRVHLGPGRASYEALQIFRFRGEEISGTWSMHDPLPWLQELGVVPDDAEIERRLDALADAPRGPG